MKRTTLVDENGNELECHLNHKGMIYLACGALHEEDLYYSGWITLDKEDALELISQLQDIVKQM